jgi:hypothetical protein
MNSDGGNIKRQMGVAKKEGFKMSVDDFNPAGVKQSGWKSVLGFQTARLGRVINVGMVAVLVLVLLMPVWAQENKKLAELTKQMEALSQRIQACGSDINCITALAQEAQKLAQEMQKIQQTGGAFPGQPAGDPGVPTRVPVTVRINNYSEYKGMAKGPGADYTCKWDGPDQIYMGNYWVFEYEAEEKGFLQYSHDFKNFYLQAPARAPYGAKQPLKWRIKKASGYRQSFGRKGWSEQCQLIKHADGGFLNIDSMHKTFVFKIYHMPPVKPGTPNLDFGPLAILVRNADTSCPDCNKSVYSPMAINPGRMDFNIGNPKEFVIAPHMMKTALEAGKWQKTFKWGRRWGQPGSYHANLLTVTIEFEKIPGILTVSPSQDFESAGPDDMGGFLPSRKTYTLRNTGGSPINFSVSKGKSWLRLSKTRGVLKPGASIQVVASVNQSAEKLNPGVHKDVLAFSNTTNGNGNTSRKAILDVGEIQIWSVKLTGQETDDMGGKLMYAKLENVWQQVTVDYGVRFDYTLGVKFAIKKEKGGWKYKTGVITNAKVGYSTNFDPTVFFISKHNCLNCKEVPNLKGTPIGGNVSGNTVKLFWPSVITRVIVTNKLKLKFVSKQKSHQGYSDNFFESSDFFQRAKAHYLPLKDGTEKKFSVIKKSSKQRFKLDNRKPISIFYRYLMKRLKP